MPASGFMPDDVVPNAFFGPNVAAHRGMFTAPHELRISQPVPSV